MALAIQIEEIYSSAALSKEITGYFKRRFTFVFRAMGSV